jgi:hypothetical protein
MDITCIRKMLSVQLVVLKNYAHNLSLEEKYIRISYSSISCAYKLYAQLLRESNLCLKII